MKKIISLIIAIMSVCTINAQSFKINRNGFFISDENKTFIVIEYAGKTKQELYNMVKQNIMTSYNNPNKVMSEDGSSTITVNGHGPIFKFKNGGITHINNGNYTLSFQFKDGKIRVNAPTVVMDGNMKDLSNWYAFKRIWDKDGNVKPDKQEYYDFINENMRLLITTLTTFKNVEEDW